jgi:glyoxylase-like metal-dependent hydrolase (beta-lactamase superfamily II)
LDTLGARLYVRHAPGHTAGSVLTFAHIDGQVHAFAGDIVLNRDYFERNEPPGSSWKPELIPEQIDLLRRTADVIIPGHGAPFTNPR